MLASKLLPAIALSLLILSTTWAEPPTAPAASTTQPTTGPADPRWPVIAQALAPGEYKDRVYTVTLPRKDLDLINELGDIPTGAGVASTFWFFGCACEKMNVVGQFCVADYESNDVIDELRAGHITVVSVSPMLMGERPRVLLVRFQGEGKTEDLAAALAKALKWMGEQRMKPEKPADP